MSDVSAASTDAGSGRRRGGSWLAACPWFGWWLPAAALLVLGWWATWFLCDDAFIAFRYVGNAHDGHGLVWNPAPFRPVEGYSCFLWVMLLWCCWVVTGLAPPWTANPLALACGLGTLWLCARGLWRLPQLERRGRMRGPLVLLVLLGIAGNHTFVTWTSSGLETALFGLCAVGWTLAAAAAPRPWLPGRFAGLCLWAAGAALTRPDGGLLVLATLAIAARDGWRPVLWRGAWPLLLPLFHLLWRRAYYGEWLPNTYYAKVTAAWPESGLRYLFCFLFEHGGMPWLALIAACGLPALQARQLWTLLAGPRAPAAIAALTWAAFVGYYTLVVGGDHFAYRPFAHLVPLAAIALCALLAHRAIRNGWLVTLLLAVAGLGDSLGWWYEAALRGREKDGFVRATELLPGPIAALCGPWERHQAWLRLRYVALPRCLHDVTCRDLLVALPPRGAGHVQGLPAGARGVYRTVAAGVVGWTLADVAVLDAVGLNDWVVARSREREPAVAFEPQLLRQLFPQFDADGDGRLGAEEIAALAARFDFGALGVPVSPVAWADLLLAICDHNGDGLDAAEFAAAVTELGNRRHMAHERTPPPGYVEALRPNVAFDGVRFAAVPNVMPLSDDEVRQTEKRFAELVTRN